MKLAVISRLVERKCPCGKTFLARAYDVKRGRGKYCSRKCMFQNRPPMAEAAKRKISEIKKRFAHLPWNYGIPHSTETREKMSTNSSCWKWGDALKQWKSESVMGEKNPNYHKPMSNQQKEKLRQAPLRQVPAVSATVIEMKMMEVLDAMGLKYEYQYVIENWITDFALPDKKLVIECDGDYWHSLPKAMIQDGLKFRRLRELGWKYIRFSESNIEKDLPLCQETIKLVISCI
jgi:very-short-patch-repair endonuclease